MNYGLLVDLRAIQGYVFSSNRLKDNLGASHLISHFFDTVSDRENGFCGGGNMFRLCKNENEAKEIITKLSIYALEQCPGLSFSAVYLDGFEPDNFQQRFIDLQRKLKEDKQGRHQITTLPSHGINAQCSASVYASEFVDYDAEGQKNFVSELVAAKRKAVKQDSDNEYADIVGDGFVLPDSFEQLGQLKDHESYIAVVYIDGNEIGNKFSQFKTLKDYQDYSCKLDEAFHSAFKDVLKETMDRITNKEWKDYLNRLGQNSSGQMFLPIRPLYIGGDDLSFVCEGRLGIELAILFMQNLRQRMQNNISCCAGIAVAKTNFPFYQTHKLATSLCRKAKQKRKAQKSAEDYLDFHLISSSVSMPLDDLRGKQYMLSNGSCLYQRPYSVSQMKAQIKNARKFQQTWPNSKIKDLRSTLYRSKEHRTAFVLQLKTRTDLSLHHDGFPDYGDELFVDKSSIYLDIIELIDMITLGGN